MTRRTLQFWGMPGFRSPEKAIPLFQSIVENAPESDRAAELQYRVGVLQEEDKAYNDAIRSFAAVQSNYPKSTFAADAAFRKARCMQVLAVRRRNNEKGLREAAAAFQDYLNRYPAHAHEAAATEARNALNERLATLYWARAVFYDEAAKEPHAAMMAYLELVENFPEASMADAARQRAEELKGADGGPAENE
jgi:outer membrane protein assembly factor BamD (BamD/ComL family)